LAEVLLFAVPFHPPAGGLLMLIGMDSQPI